MMETSQKLFFTLLLIFFSMSLVITGSEGGGCHYKRGRSRPKKLFVFGDSYVDTGNTNMSSGGWKVPSGITFPGIPSGRSSDGRISTDFLAKYLGLKSPLPYRWRKYKQQNSKYGMNFAYGGSGVFETLSPYPNMTTQIDFFQQLIKEKMFNHRDLHNSVALISLAGNDYATYLAKGGTIEGLPPFIQRVINQLDLNLQRIYNLGVKKIVVGALQPLGCLPQFTMTNQFQQCNATINQAFGYHNLLLQKVVAKLNSQTTYNAHGSPFITLDLYNAFLSILQSKESQQGSLRFNKPLTPCCFGINQNYSCGSVDALGNKMYTLCQDPKSSFFWDSVHLTEAGWAVVYSNLQANLEQLCSS